MRAYVPITASQSAAVTVIDADDPTSCSEVEADGRLIRIDSPQRDGRFIMDWGRQALTGAGLPPNPSTSRTTPIRWSMSWDSAVGPDTACALWLDVPDRSFSEASIVEREVLVHHAGPSYGPD